MRRTVHFGLLRLEKTCTSMSETAMQVELARAVDFGPAGRWTRVDRRASSLHFAVKAPPESQGSSDDDTPISTIPADAASRLPSLSEAVFERPSPDRT